MRKVSSSVRISRAGFAVGAFFCVLLPVTVTALPNGEEGPTDVITGIGRVVDGDTLDVGATRVRLEGIDAPEIAQTCRTAAGDIWNCGVAAAAALRKLAEHKLLACDRKGTDRYNRVLATCFADGIDIDAAMVRAGFAWAFVKYSVAYVGAEAEARAAKVGVWQGDAEAPWDFRRDKWQVAETRTTNGCAIKGNVSSRGRIYHMPWDHWYSDVNMDLRKGKRWFCTEAEAIAAGWRHASPN